MLRLKMHIFCIKKIYCITVSEWTNDVEPPWDLENPFAGTKDITDFYDADSSPSVYSDFNNDVERPMVQDYSVEGKTSTINILPIDIKKNLHREANHCRGFPCSCCLPECVPLFVRLSQLREGHRKGWTEEGAAAAATGAIVNSTEVLYVFTLLYLQNKTKLLFQKFIRDPAARPTSAISSSPKVLISGNYKRD